MFQRLKGALDARIAEEQARQQAAQSSLNSPSRSDSRSRRLNQRADSPAARSSRPPPPDRVRKDGTSPEGPEPSAFEPEFIIAADDGSSRSSTPLPAERKPTEPTSNGISRAFSVPAENKSGLNNDAVEGTESNDCELPPDVRGKLRRLEKLESRYHELLRSYRVAHARVQTIEPFETALRECTPLVSINDPNGFSEYLNQVNLKGDMVVDELKRVSSERDSLRTKVTEAESSAREAWNEVSGLKQAVQAVETQQPEEKSDGDIPIDTRTRLIDAASVQSAGDAGSNRSVANLNASKAASSSSAQEEEDFFSFDEEIPRLQQALRERQETIDTLTIEVKSLKGDLAVTRESTQSMVESLEEATRELNVLRDFKDRSDEASQAQKEASMNALTSLRSKLEAAESFAKNSPPDINRNEASIDDLNRRLEEAHGQLAKYRSESRGEAEATAKAERLQASLEESEVSVESLNKEKAHASKRAETLDKLVATLRSQLAQMEAREKTVFGNDGDAQEHFTVPGDLGTTMTASDQVPTATRKKNNKKRKKGSNNEAAKGNSVQPAMPLQEAMQPEVTLGKNGPVQSGSLQDELRRLREALVARESAIEGLERRLKDQEDLQEEIETLRDDLINVGQEHVSAKDRVKQLTDEKTHLQSRISDLEKELLQTRSTQSDSEASRNEHEDLEKRFSDLRTKCVALQSDLSAAQQLAAARFKDMNDLKKIIEKAQPELAYLRTEASKLKTLQSNVEERDAEIRSLENKQTSLRVDLSGAKQTVSERDTEIKALNQRMSQETSSRLRSEALQIKSTQDSDRSKQEKKEAVDSLGRLSNELTKVQRDLATAKARLGELEQHVAQHSREKDILREEMDLKSAQYASAQSLMSSMRDQTNEMAMQMKEARDRCESLEEEVGDVHRLLSGRSREAETMRRLLADVESRADARTREMKERVEVAVEERDRAEDEASTTGRRTMRELEELRGKLRDTERGLKRTEEDKEELELAQRDWKRRREELEKQSERSLAEVNEVRHAMSELRDVLDDAEKQARDLEKQKAELRRSVDETQQRLEKLRKSHKSMAEEMQTMRSTKNKGVDQSTPPSRSSLDSTPARGGLASPPHAIRRGSSMTNETAAEAGTAPGTLDTVYLKNVLLQFLEQKDRKHQMQLIPVLGMLLHFDRTEEQKWMSAISSK